MEEKQQNRDKYYKFLIFTCVGLYVAMMAVKQVYVAEINTIIRIFDTNKSNASMMNTYYFITYAITQFLLGFLMQKLNVKKYLLITVPLSIITYVILALFVQEIRGMIWLFLVNGFAQAGVYACTRLTLGKYLPAKYTATANMIYSLGQGGGFALSYGLSAICVSFFSWRVPFLIFAGVFGIMLVLYIISVKLAEKNCPLIVPQENEKATVQTKEEGLIKLKGKGSAVFFIIYWMLFTFTYSAVRYGLNNWLVSYLHEVFGFPESLSMAVTIVLEVAAMIGPVIGILLCKKKRNYISVMTALFVIPLILAAVMLFVLKVNIVLSVVLLIVFEVFLAAGHSGVSVMSFDMRTSINVGSFSAFTNTTSSIAAGVVPSVIGALIDNFGYHVQYAVIFGMLLVVVGMLVIYNLFVVKRNASAPQREGI